jgi:hypothetical protein
MRKMKTFNDTVLQKNDVNLHGLGYSEDFVAFVEQDLLWVILFSSMNIIFNRSILL